MANWCWVSQTRSPQRIVSPKSQLSHTLPQVIVLQDIECRELVRVHALHAQDLYARSGEAALRCLWRSLHEQHHRRGLYGTIDGLPYFIGKQADLRGRQKAWGKLCGGEDTGGPQGRARSLDTLENACMKKKRFPYDRKCCPRKHLDGLLVLLSEACGGKWFTNA